MNVVVIPGLLQHGAKAGYQCLEVVGIIRLALEKACLWGCSLIILSLDVLKAYDQLSLEAVITVFEKSGQDIKMVKLVFHLKALLPY